MHTDQAGMATPAQMRQLEMQAAFYRTQSTKRPLQPLPPVKIQTYTIDYCVLDPQLKPQPTPGAEARTLEFAVAAFDEDGKVLNGIVNDGVEESPRPTSGNQSAGNKSGLFRMQQTLIVPVNAKSIRVGVRDRANDRMGTLEVALPIAAEAVAKK
jgi:hypothetical protein